MKLYIAPRAGIWCRSVSGWDSFRAALAAGSPPATPVEEPFPDLLPAREGRRAPRHVRLAIEAGAQACRENGVDPGQVITVFASAMGDIQITDYMCRTLAGPAPMLSPTRFHNSVHNAASGYWAIGAGNRSSSVAVASQANTVSSALLEAATLAACESRMVLLIVHDVQAPVPLDAVCPNRQPFAAGLIISPQPVTPEWLSLEINCEEKCAAWPEMSADWLGRLVADNDCARSLPLLAALAEAGPVTLSLPLGTECSLRLRIRA